MASQSIGRILFKAFGILAFCAVSGYALFLAYGYNYDLQHRQIEKISLIDIINRYSEVRVFLNDQLIGNNLPLQVKDLVPGNYRLSVSKLGFLAWARSLQVRPDIVTKVDDILLVPDDLTQFTKQLVHFDEKSQFYAGDDLLLVQTPGQDFLTLVYFLDHGTIKEDELHVNRSDIKNIALYPQQRLLLSYADNSYQWISFSSSDFIPFALPDGAHDLTLVASENSFYYLNNGFLYRVPFDQIGKFRQKSYDTFKIRSAVDSYTVGTDSVFYLSKGMLYSSDKQGKAVRLFDQEAGHIKNLRFVATADAGYLVLRDQNDRRLLYLVQDGDHLGLLSDDLKGDVFGDGAGRLLYAENSGKIYVYKTVLKKKFLVTTMPADFTLLDWFDGSGHFLFQRQDMIFLADSTFTNVYPFVAYQNGATYVTYHGALFTLMQGRLKVLDWLDAQS